MTIRQRCDVVRRVAVVAPAVVPYDAISAAAADTCRMLMGMDGLEICLLTTWCEVPDLPTVQVSGLAQMMRNRAFLEADLLIYHFGIYHSLFDAILVGNGRARQVVHFHNITPSEFLEASDRDRIEVAIRQMHNLERADVVWGASETNLRTLCEHGVIPMTTALMPIVVDTPVRTPLSGKRGELVEILYLGRFVRSKGVLELLHALRALYERGCRKFRLRLVGNEAYSNPDYIAQLRTTAADLGLAVEFLGQVTDAVRDKLLREAHLLAVPSYHEGFCKPVVEALRAGCVPVGFASYNLPDICAGLGRLVSPGDVAALSHALGDVIEGVGEVIAGRTSATLRLDCGGLLASTFDRRAQEHTLQFERKVLQERTREAVTALLHGGEHLRSASIDQNLVSIAMTTTGRPQLNCPHTASDSNTCVLLP